MVSLTQLMSTVKNSPVSVGFVKARVPDNVDVVHYKQLKGKHRREVFKGKRAVVVLIPKKGSKMGHFVCLLPREKHIEYFSSLGGSWRTELDKLHESSAIFEELLGSRWIYNKVKLQQNLYHINDCAAWVLARCHLSKLKLREFVQLFSKRLTLNQSDDIVALLTTLLFVDKK